MKIFAVSDLHLLGSMDKPMIKFGDHWCDHWNKIRKDWLSKVCDSDVVVIPGDISWAMKFEDAVPDLNSISELPGYKVILRGNHDYWWSSVSRLRTVLPKNFYALQNDCVIINDLVICGSRGWLVPNTKTTKDDEKIFSRETLRLKLSIDAMNRTAEKRYRLGIMHYPPFSEGRASSAFTDLFASSGVTKVVYGHLHGIKEQRCQDTEIDGVTYINASCDMLDFKLILVDEI